jgi:YfiH family protein
MQTYTIDGIKLLFFENLSSHNSLFHAVSTRIGGVSREPFESFNLGLNTEDTYENILSNHMALSKALRFDLQTLTSSHQVHGNNIISVEKKPDKRTPFTLEHTFNGFDSLVTDQPGITLMVRVADCIPIIFFDTVKKVLAVVHAGWKGTLGEIAAKTVKEMVNRYSSRACDIKAGIGPSIGPCCYYVQKYVADLYYNKFSDAEIFIKKEKNGFFIDLWEANRLQLIMQGCREENIEISALCTSCNSHLFFSNRREQGKTGRFGLLAGLRA